MTADRFEPSWNVRRPGSSVPPKEPLGHRLVYHIDPLYSPFIRSMCVVPFGLERAEQQVLHRRRRSAPVVLPTSSTTFGDGQ